jgi:flagellum-specific peptidoglycan hydrolase FlgJ
MIKMILLGSCVAGLVAHMIMPDKYYKYIRTHGHKAQMLQITHGIPPSIQIAQAIYESGAGSSNIAKQSNNHFGIRCGDGWDGEIYESKSGCWRKYSNIGHSYLDHANFLAKYYPDACFKDWKHWVKHCKGYGGAGYWKKIGRIIRMYKLYELDFEIVR